VYCTQQTWKSVSQWLYVISDRISDRICCNFL
jgi:hypothetical protein